MQVVLALRVSTQRGLFKMAKLSKRVKAFRERVDANKSYPLDEAIAILKETATAKFNESVEVAVNLGVDARKSDCLLYTSDAADEL